MLGRFSTGFFIGRFTLDANPASEGNSPKRVWPGQSVSLQPYLLSI